MKAVFLTLATHMRLKAYVAKRGLKIGHIVNSIINDWLDRHEQEN